MKQFLCSLFGHRWVIDRRAYQLAKERGIPHTIGQSQCCTRCKCGRITFVRSEYIAEDAEAA